MKIYVGNLPFSATESELRELFEAHGTVNEVSVITDRDTGRPRGFAFVEMPDDQGNAAIQAIDGFEMGGRNLKVAEAKPKEDRGGRGGGGGRRDRW
ncbi:MAG: RNA-binding protein [Candidatus Eisenbacteria bacterium]